MAGLRWTTTPADAWSALALNYRARIEIGIVAIAQRWAPEIENEMRRAAPWQDRTGNARQGLHTEVNHMVGQMVQIVLSHGVSYGIFLELANAGRFAIINPTLDRYAPRVWADVVRMLR